MRVLNKLVADSSHWSVTLQNISMLLLKIHVCIIHSWFYMFYRRREEYNVHIFKHPSLSKYSAVHCIFRFYSWCLNIWSNMVFRVWYITLRFARTWKSCGTLASSIMFSQHSSFSQTSTYGSIHCNSIEIQSDRLTCFQIFSYKHVYFIIQY